MILHLINHSPFTHTGLTEATPLIESGDTVLFVDDGVYAVLQQEPLRELHKRSCRITFLEEDLHQRGLPVAGVEAITMATFVELAFTAKNTVSWY